MALYRRLFTIPEVANVHRSFIDAITLYETVENTYARLGKPGVAAGTVKTLQAAYLNFNRGLDAVAKQTAAEAKTDIVRVLKQRQKRPNTGMGRHLSGAIICRPVRDFGNLATGQVGVADIAVLDSVVNPFGPQYGPYWRAIEEGIRKHVGRTIHGAFFGPGMASGPFAADPTQAGRHPLFVTSKQSAGAFADIGFTGGAGKKGGTGGRRMTIGRPIIAEHFIRDGANQASVRWKAEVAAVQARAVRDIGAVTGPLP